MNIWLTLQFFLVFLGALCATGLVLVLARRFGIVDKPNKERKLHKKATPLLGGLAIYLVFFLVLFFNLDKLTAGALGLSHWLGFFAGASILMLGGFLDDKYDLRPRQQLLFPVLAAAAVIAGGVEIEKISNPFGGFLYLNSISLPLLTVGGKTLGIALLSDALIFFWLLGMMYTTKLLDGVDGLVASISLIGSLIIFAFTSTPAWSQPDIALAAFVLAAAILGFLVYNWHPARIFLGEGGALFLGFSLGVLSIISGGKFAVALLIMGIPILDVAWTIVRRLKAGKNPFKTADRGHLHFRFLDLGLGQRETVALYSFISLLFGLGAIFLQSRGKVLALAGLLVLMFLLIFGFNYLEKKKHG